MRISYLFHQLGFTGGNVVLYNFMDKLSERGHEVYAVTPIRRIRWQPRMARQLIEARGVRPGGRYRLRKLLGKGLGKFPRMKRWIKMALGEERKPMDQLVALTEGLLRNWTESDITVSTFCFTAYANYALMDKTLPLYHMQHYEELFFREEVEQKFARLTYFMPLGLISNSSWLKKQIKQRTGRASYLVNPGISQELFHPYHDVVEKYLAAEKIRVVSYSDERDFKGWEDGVAAMRMVFSELGPAKVEWIVFGNQNPGKLDIPVEYAGKVFNEKLAKLYSSAYVVFLSSWYESFPLQPLEAMNCGTAVVTTRLGTEDYAYDGDSCLVVQPRNPRLLANAIISLAKDPTLAETIASKGLEVAKAFTWDKATDSLEAVFERSFHDYPLKGAFSDIADLVAQGYSESQAPRPI
jgi:glycosyltransferase involved in cell wall biosynthesis